MVTSSTIPVMHPLLFSTKNHFQKSAALIFVTMHILLLISVFGSWAHPWELARERLRQTHAFVMHVRKHCIFFLQTQNLNPIKPLPHFAFFIASIIGGLKPSWATSNIQGFQVIRWILFFFFFYKVIVCSNMLSSVDYNSESSINWSVFTKRMLPIYIHIVN